MVSISRARKALVLLMKCKDVLAEFILCLLYHFLAGNAR